MPVARLKHLSDDDALAGIAYLRAQPAVVNSTPPKRLSLVAIALAGLGIFGFDGAPITAPVVAPPRAPSTEYGAYLVSYKDCRDCHGEQLDGKPSGHALQPPMPWKTCGSMDDLELTAVYEYLKAHRYPGESAAVADSQP